MAHYVRAKLSPGPDERKLQRISSIVMRLARIVLPLVVTLSLVTLPMGQEHTAGASANDVVASAFTLDCGGNNRQPSDHNSKAPTGSTAMAGCATQCFNSAATLISTAIYAPVATTRTLVLADAGAVSQIGIPPFRPPRV